MLRALRLQPFSTLLLLFLEAGCDPSVFCYRMGVGLFAAGRARFLAPSSAAAGFASALADWPRQLLLRNQVACCNLFSTFSTRFSTQKD